MSIKTIVIGVDPGIKGAIAFYDAISKSLLSVHDMPSYNCGPKGKTKVDAQKLAGIIEAAGGVGHSNVTLAVVEMVGARPGQGVTGMFNFGYAAGLVAGALAAFQIPTHFVQPSVWKSLLGLSYDKDLSREMAARKFPTHAQSFARKKDDGRAEAALIAQFGAERLLPKLIPQQTFEPRDNGDQFE